MQQSYGTVIQTLTYISLFSGVKICRMSKLSSMFVHCFVEIFCNCYAPWHLGLWGACTFLRSQRTLFTTKTMLKFLKTLNPHCIEKWKSRMQTAPYSTLTRIFLLLAETGSSWLIIACLPASEPFFRFQTRHSVDLNAARWRPRSLHGKTLFFKSSELGDAPNGHSIQLSLQRTRIAVSGSTRLSYTHAETRPTIFSIFLRGESEKSSENLFQTIGDIKNPN